MRRRTTWGLSALAFAAYSLAAAAAFAAGFRFWVPWAVVQLLDRGELQRAPLHALLSLHGQPPVLNAVLAAALRLSAVLGCQGCRPEAILAVLFFLLGGIVVVLLALLVRALTGSPRLAIAAVALLGPRPARPVRVGDAGVAVENGPGELERIEWRDVTRILVGGGLFAETRDGELADHPRARGTQTHHRHRQILRSDFDPDAGSDGQPLCEVETCH